MDDRSQKYEDTVGWRVKSAVVGEEEGKKKMGGSGRVI
jgi:hypothetical protein